MQNGNVAQFPTKEESSVSGAKEPSSVVVIRGLPLIEAKKMMKQCFPGLELQEKEGMDGDGGIYMAKEGGVEIEVVKI